VYEKFATQKYQEKGAEQMSKNYYRIFKLQKRVPAGFKIKQYVDPTF
jgi:hypothetical protein